ncbi:hypothetical protein SAMN04488070_1146 [Pseudidiomarina maritima]|uniref:Glycosyltransferase family 52 n=1 Tax=Pseudidiomarina maritima TaxID=519453 RepID=A0A1I6GRZ1_9GAMM|nr:glycosyltransferase family 52 [Pseudidiomarina maritima]SFR45005.1 hypothetical protein SAMN04488070_1146 [Pseudidiomarina maritima]
MTKFIAVAPKIASSYQLLSLLSYVRANHNEIKATYVFLDPYWHANQIPSRYTNYCEKYNVIFVKTAGALPNSKAIKEAGCKLLRFYVNNVSLKSVLLRRQDRVVLIADGLGTYVNCASKINAVTRERGKPTLNEKRKIFNYMLMSNVAERFSSVHSYMIFDKASLKLDKSFVEQFKISMTELRCSKDDELVNHLIFISQPLVKLGVLTEERYLELLKHLEQRAREKRLAFLVKPHPAEDVDWYFANNFSALDFDGVIEEFGVNNPRNEFISFLSSALLTLPYLTESTVYRLPLPEFERNIVLSSAQRELLSRVQPLYLKSFND